LSTSTYHHTPKHAVVNIRHAQSRAIENEDDPREKLYLELRRLMPGVKRKRLWAITHINEKFRIRWNTVPTEEEKEHMAYHLACYELTTDEIVAVISTWYWNEHGKTPPNDGPLKAMIQEKITQAYSHIREKKEKALAKCKLHYENDAEWRAGRLQYAKDQYRLKHPEAAERKARLGNVVLDHLRFGSLSPKSLVELTGAKRGTLKDCVRRLAEKGKIVKVGRGEYALPLDTKTTAV
jgi:hypothetical protein